MDEVRGEVQQSMAMVVGVCVTGWRRGMGALGWKEREGREKWSEMAVGAAAERFSRMEP